MTKEANMKEAIDSIAQKDFFDSINKANEVVGEVVKTHVLQSGLNPMAVAMALGYQQMILLICLALESNSSLNEEDVEEAMRGMLDVNISQIKEAWQAINAVSSTLEEVTQ